MYTLDDLEIVVMANKRKEALTPHFLDQYKVPYRVFYTTDYEWSDTSIPISLLGLTGGNVGAYRCYRGHQDIVKSCKKRFALVLEDDARPNDPHWLDVVLAYLPSLKDYQLISLHGRDWQKYGYDTIEQTNKYSLYRPKQGMINPHLVGAWVLGSLAYLIEIGSDAYHTLLSTPYNGIPMDLWLANYESFALVDPSPFDHVRDKGSLIDNADFNYRPKI